MIDNNDKVLSLCKVVADMSSSDNCRGTGTREPFFLSRTEGSLAIYLLTLRAGHNVNRFLLGAFKPMLILQRCLSQTKVITSNSNKSAVE